MSEATIVSCSVSVSFAICVLCGDGERGELGEYNGDRAELGEYNGDLAYCTSLTFDLSGWGADVGDFDLDFDRIRPSNLKSEPELLEEGDDALLCLSWFPLVGGHTSLSDGDLDGDAANSDED